MRSRVKSLGRLQVYRARRFFVCSQPILRPCPLLSTDSLLDCVGAHFRTLKIRINLELFNLNLGGLTVFSSALLRIGGDYARTRNIAPGQSGALAPIIAGDQG